MKRDSEEARKGRRIALIIAGVGVFWILVTAIGAEYGWSHRTRALFDLAALAGFGGAIWMTYQLWRARQTDKD
jgi:threonine/homoserine/homoserine lactone efflux protein